MRGAVLQGMGFAVGYGTGILQQSVHAAIEAFSRRAHRDWHLPACSGGGIQRADCRRIWSLGYQTARVGTRAVSARPGRKFHLRYLTQRWYTSIFRRSVAPEIHSCTTFLVETEHNAE